MNGADARSAQGYRKNDQAHDLYEAPRRASIVRIAAPPLVTRDLCFSDKGFVRAEGTPGDSSRGLVYKKSAFADLWL